MLQVPLEIAFHNIESSEWAEQEVRARVAELEKLYDRLVSCRVHIDQRNKDLTGTIPPVVHIELGIPGRPDLVVSHEPDHLLRKYQHPDLHKAINEAFRIAERQLARPQGAARRPDKNRRPRRRKPVAWSGCRDHAAAGFRIPAHQRGRPALFPPQLAAVRRLRRSQGRRGGLLQRGRRRHRPDRDQGAGEGQKPGHGVISRTAIALPR